MYLLISTLSVCCRGMRETNSLIRRAESWDIAALAGSLDVAPTEATDVAHGVGQRFILGEPGGGEQTTLELYAERGVVRFTSLAEGVQVTLFGQEIPPRLT